MLFNSFSFIFVFLPLFIVLYCVFPKIQQKNIILLLASVLFYSWTDYKLVFIILIELVFAYFMAKIIDKENAIRKNISFIFSIVMVVGVLFSYKYLNFFTGLLSLNIKLEFGSLPLGLSFYTFNLISYLADVYRKKISAEKNIFYTALYILFFPFVLSGPLQRYDYLKNQMLHRETSITEVSNGIRRFIIGLGKKVILANNLAVLSDFIFNELSYSDYSSSICWLGAICYALQLFYDFSGYSDMAIGLANAFGFKSVENFNYPYMASSITDFWRRWHISLSTWFKDYIYIPLGGNRKGKIHWCINILVVWILTGLWHGAAENYVVWGLYFGMILIIEKLVLLKWLDKAYIIRNVYCIFVVLIGWVIFRCSSFEQIAAYVSAMFSSVPAIDFSLFSNLGYLYLIPYLLIGILLSLNIWKNLFMKMNKKWYTGILCDLILAVIFCICIVFMINESYSPFLYFQY